MGSIYIDAENSQILNDTNINNHTLPESNNPSGLASTTGIILAVVSIVIIVGAGYWFNSRRK